ncbi:MAG TPA: tryptophan synthase subunit alpha [Chthoniobacterales bacterium]
MQNRIDAKFAQLRAARQCGLMAYLTGGDPNLGATVAIALALADAGTDFLEIGVPFSDPLADGLANQLGAQRALTAGTTLPGVLGAVAEIRSATQMPIILYTYLNPIFQYGLDRFEHDASAAGADGVLLLDLPPDERLIPDPRALRLHRIRLVAPTTDDSRLQTITAGASGFIYYVSREGVTGEQKELAVSIPEKVAKIRQYTTLPVAVGFGIANSIQAAAVAAVADAVVVGSAIVRRIGENGRDPGLAHLIGDFARPLAEAVHAARLGPKADDKSSRR